MPDITPSDEQWKAIKAIKEWYLNGTEQTFYLAGYAGSGKSTIAKLAVAECGIDPDSPRDVRYGSFTGKAALVMQRKGMYGATTVHRMIYRLIDDTDELVFELNFEDSPLLDAKMACLDECSMINEEMGSDLLKFGKKVLVLGDPGQLQPVRGQGFFTTGKPDFFLKEIHRQALENPIIRMSKLVRETGRLPMGDEGAFRKVRAEEVDENELMQADQILTGKHVSRHDLNRMMLDCHDYDLSYPLQKGVKVICIKNSRKRDPEAGESYQLLNGMIGYTSDTRTEIDLNRERRHFFQSVEFPDENMGVNNIPIYMGPFEEHWGVKVSNEQKDRDKLLMRGFEQFDFGYAITTHKCVSLDERIPILGRGMPKIGTVDVGDVTPFGVIRGLYPTDQIPYKIITRRGYEITTSSDHRWCTKSGLTETGNLVVGDEIELASIPTFPGTSSMSDEHAWALGMMVGDGCYTDRDDGTIHLACKRADSGAEIIGNRYQDYIRSLGLTCNWRNDDRGLHHSSKGFRKQLLDQGLDYVKGRKKKLPDGVWESGPNAWRHFLGGLFDADGSVRRSGVVYTMVSPGLAADVQLMLLALGIVTRRVEYKHGGKYEGRTYWNIYVTAQSLPQFRREIKISHPMKIDQLSLKNPNRMIDYCDGYDEIISVEKLSDDTIPMIDIEIDDPHILSFGPFMGHNSQGSQWDNVFLFDDGFGSWDDLERKRWLYTAITRAAERVTVMV